MGGFEWWTGSHGQWLFVAMTIAPVIACLIMEAIDAALGKAER